MKTVTSKDGTTIAFDQFGEGGPTLIQVGGMFQQRAGDAETDKLVTLLAEHFTFLSYDRRGRGDSTDTLPFSIQREVEDIEALIDHAGGPAFLVGISSGAALAFEAAIVLGGKVKGLAMYEAPYNDDPDGRRDWREFRRKLDEALAQGRRSDAVGLFMMLLGMPAEQLEGMHQHPMWPAMEALAPTMAYDAAVVGEDASTPVERAARLATPTLVMVGGATPYPFMGVSAEALANALPHGQLRTLEGQTHEVAASALAEALVEFFTQ